MGVIEQWIERDDADYLLAEFNDRIVGFLSVQRAAHPQFPQFRPYQFALIDNAVVDEPHRGNGLGAKLLEAAIQWAKDHELRHLQTTVWHDNVDAREFYLSQGFRPMTVRLEIDTTEDEHTEGR